MTNFSLYHASITAMDNYKQAEAVFRAYVLIMPAFQPTSEYFRLKTARDKAKREFEKADKVWKREWARNNKEKNDE